MCAIAFLFCLNPCFGAQVYFAVAGLDLLSALDKISNKDAIIEWVHSLQIISLSARAAADEASPAASVAADGSYCARYPLSIVCMVVNILR